MEVTGAEKGMFSEAEYNPVGSYIKYFDLDKSMCGKRIHICFEGVEEAMYLWLNGQFVGYAEDSFTPSEFDLTPYIKEKGNVLAVQVHKMSTAAFLEDQDFFRFFGIFRNVTLKAIPDVHMDDVWFKPVLNQDNVSGSVTVSMKVSAPDAQNITANFILKDREENLVAEKSVQLKKENDHLEGTICIDLETVELWDNHDPYLYHAYVELKAEDGSLAEVIPYDIGFRRIEIIDKIIYLNGKRLIITGVTTKNSPYIASMYKKNKSLSNAVLNAYVSATGCRKEYIWETDSMSGNNWSKVPTTLIEMGYMSNPSEDRLMQQTSYQKKMVRGIAKGIENYLTDLSKSLS